MQVSSISLFQLHSLKWSELQQNKISHNSSQLLVNDTFVKSNRAITSNCKLSKTNISFGNYYTEDTTEKILKMLEEKGIYTSDIYEFPGYTKAGNFFQNDDKRRLYGRLTEAYDQGLISKYEKEELEHRISHKGRIEGATHPTPVKDESSAEPITEDIRNTNNIEKNIPNGSELAQYTSPEDFAEGKAISFTDTPVEQLRAVEENGGLFDHDVVASVLDKLEEDGEVLLSPNSYEALNLALFQNQLLENGDLLAPVIDWTDLIDPENITHSLDSLAHSGIIPNPEDFIDAIKNIVENIL